MKDQVDEQVEEKSKDTQEETVLTTEQQVEEVGKLLREETDETETETQTETQTETPEAETTEETQQETQVTPVIDDELIAKFPTLKMYRGQPITEALPKAYDSIVRKSSTVLQDYAKLKKQLEEKSLPTAKEAPDKVDEPEKFEQWFKEAVQKAYEAGKQETVPQQTVDIPSMLQKELPDVDIAKVSDEFAKYNASRFYDEYGNIRPEIQGFYQKNPVALVGEIKNFYNLWSKAQKDEATITKESKAQANKELKNSFKQANKTKKNVSQANFNSTERTTDMSAEDELLLLIAEKQGITQQE